MFVSLLIDIYTDGTQCICVSFVKISLCASVVVSEYLLNTEYIIVFYIFVFPHAKIMFCHKISN